ncbi:hypothetical protein RCL1_001969 [Eukaryota sp. TZLM3-RCL]
MKPIIACALSGAIGLMTVFWATVSSKEWSFLLVLAFGVLSPLAEVLLGDSDPYGDQGLVIIGKFLTAALMTSGFCLPSILFHVQSISHDHLFQFVIAMFGAGLFYLSVTIFIYKFTTSKDSMW